jgi:hypothetical protein
MMVEREAVILIAPKSLRGIHGTFITHADLGRRPTPWAGLELDMEAAVVLPMEDDVEAEVVFNFLLDIEEYYLNQLVTWLLCWLKWRRN